MVSLGDNFRASSHARTDSCTYGRPFAATRKRANDASNGSSSNSPFGCTRSLRLAREFVFSGDQRHSLAIYDDSRQLDFQFRPPVKVPVCLDSSNRP